ncbi:hypothetical protein Godav_023514 [Gossypium davidsonii]|uniref:HTH CENPB-type domain-containing protein n=1 Tax=Gossypium davidsonii TaxID=34287 RepID=A0A7J8SSU6_GOSDV|nr:hypothetical protein [Gossypium davidsonii]
MYGDANSKFNFSIGWLERFKARHGIKSYRRFGESRSFTGYKANRRTKKGQGKDLLLWFIVIGMVQIKCLFGLLQLRFIIDIAFILASWKVTRKEK